MGACQIFCILVSNGQPPVKKFSHHHSCRSGEAFDSLVVLWPEDIVEGCSIPVIFVLEKLLCCALECMVADGGVEFSAYSVVVDVNEE